MTEHIPVQQDWDNFVVILWLFSGKIDCGSR